MRVSGDGRDHGGIFEGCGDALHLQLEEVWKFQTGTGVVSSAITWEQDGEQWIGVAAGWGGAVPLWGGEVAKSTAGINPGGSFWAFRLPKKVATR